jgi:hypothetical protein
MLGLLRAVNTQLQRSVSGLRGIAWRKANLRVVAFHLISAPMSYVLP